MFSCVQLFEVNVSLFYPSKYLYLPCTSQMSAKETQRFCKEPDVKIHYPGRHLQENECCVKIAAKVAQIASENLTNHRCSRNRRHALMGSFLRDLSSKQTSRIASKKQQCCICDWIIPIFLFIKNTLNFFEIFILIPRLEDIFIVSLAYAGIQAVSLACWSHITILNQSER